MVVVVRVMVNDEGAREMEEGVKGMVAVVRVVVANEGIQEIEEGANVRGKVVVVRLGVKEMVAVVGVVVRNEGIREIEERVRGKVVVVRVSGDWMERWVMMEEKEGEKQNQQKEVKMSGAERWGVRKVDVEGEVGKMCGVRMVWGVSDLSRTCLRSD